MTTHDMLGEYSLQAEDEEDDGLTCGMQKALKPCSTEAAELCRTRKWMRHTKSGRLERYDQRASSYFTQISIGFFWPVLWGF